MLSLDRKFHFKAFLFIKKSILLPNKASPKEDVINWLFLQIGENLYGFVYKMLNENLAQYENPFEVEISIFAFDFMETSIRFGNVYKVFRGQEEIGFIKIYEKLENRLC